MHWHGAHVQVLAICQLIIQLLIIVIVVLAVGVAAA